MNGLPCRYAIVQFLPYAETGEFANIGVVLSCPQLRYLGVEMAPANRSKRVTDFFSALTATTYKSALKLVRDDYQRLAADVLAGYLPADIAFAEITRPRETMIRCGRPRAIIATGHPSELVQALYRRFVEKDFATKEYHETILERLVAQTLTDASVRDLFRSEKVGDSDYNVSFPFVHGDAQRPAAVIKPLHLAHAEASKVIDHGLHWVGRLDRLKRHGSMPHQVLFAVDTAAEGKPLMAADEIIQDLKRLGAQVAPTGDAAQIVRFANNARLI